MKSLNEKHFKEFKMWCDKYANKYAINGWEIEYRFHYIDNICAITSKDSTEKRAMIILSSKMFDFYDGLPPLRMMAKHEIIHILISDLKENSRQHNLFGVPESEEYIVDRLIKLLI
jgi:hypothetical protein